ncbi:MAG: AraC family ligand binding domain-containing protein [Clostridia bacterium]|nr:AraC family ligand binding domain-containing protein [Clostridia bacterium]
MNTEHDYYVESENEELKNGSIELLYTYHKCEGNLIFPHIHESIEFLYILNGEFLIYADRSKYYLKPGDLIMLRSNTIHRTYSMSSGFSHYFVMKIKPFVLLSLSGGNNGYAYIMRFILLFLKSICLNAGFHSGRGVKI